MNGLFLGVSHAWQLHLSCQALSSKAVTKRFSRISWQSSSFRGVAGPRWMVGPRWMGLWLCCGLLSKGFRGGFMSERTKRSSLLLR